MAAGFKTATVASAEVAATLTNYPTYIDLDRLGITTLAEAQSVRVYAESAKTTEWAREIVSVTEMHVKVPSLTTTVEIFVDWDGVRSDYAVGATYGRNAVWSDYEAVYHLEENPAGSSPQMVDSTGNGNSGTSAGSMTSGDSVAGKLNGKGLEFDGSNDQIGFGNVLDMEDLFTISGWVKTSVAAFSGLLDTRQAGTPQAGYVIGLNSTGAPMNIIRDTSNKQSYAYGNTSINNGVFRMVHGTVDQSIATGLKIYADGAEVTYGAQPSPIGTGTITSATAATMATCQQGVLGRLTGVLDEVRARGSIVSSTWVTTEYNNQNDEASFWGTWSDAGGGGGGVVNPSLLGLGRI